MKRAATVLMLLVIGIGAAVYLYLQTPSEQPLSASSSGSEPARAPVVSAPPAVGSTPPVSQAERKAQGSPLAARLNAPDTPPAEDVVILRDLIRQYLTALQRRPGPPIGDDADLVRALGGRNPLKLTVIPSGHPAISDKGRLLDRWGTPYHIHARSSQSYEVRSAGPDQKLFTSDDLLAPP